MIGALSACVLGDMSVELVVEDGSDGAVAEGSDLDGARGSGLDTEPRRRV